ncbi:YbaY family lipoprotein [Variovorax sp. J2P1-59]|uniref:YbaY family lipoprotein n=1 Tax=Variovorax flavidus TaxID=3053501 RepID=UPI0025765D1C|nr:YbaY family lipoprotein [Variovorax sp. J2P1-59]MDM0075614.1 YbaY family lipoprotein [Variovorax sp. J2P1-59]
MNKRTALLALAAAASLPLLVACASSMSNVASADKAPPLRVTGSVTFRERIALDPSAEIVVQLLDVSRMDVAAVVLAEQRIRANGKQVPFSFALSVDPARIDPRMRYNVSARILEGDKLLFISDTAYPVLTQGRGNTADLMLVRASR